MIAYYKESTQYVPGRGNQFVEKHGPWKVTNVYASGETFVHVRVTAVPVDYDKGGNVKTSVGESLCRIDANINNFTW